jgi:uncharacterized glyoxalase superfamily protein PhnB
LRNRSVPDATVIPVLDYDDVAEAAASGSHRPSASPCGSGSRITACSSSTAIAIDGGAGSGSAGSVLVQVDEADEHHARAVAAGARIVSPPTDSPYGERQYTAEDVGGHRWTFSQSVADVESPTGAGSWSTPSSSLQLLVEHELEDLGARPTP